MQVHLRKQTSRPHSLRYSIVQDSEVRVEGSQPNLPEEDIPWSTWHGHCLPACSPIFHVTFHKPDSDSEQPKSGNGFQLMCSCRRVRSFNKAGCFAWWNICTGQGLAIPIHSTQWFWHPPPHVHCMGSSVTLPLGPAHVGNHPIFHVSRF